MTVDEFKKAHNVADDDLFWPDPEDPEKRVMRDVAKWKLANLAAGKDAGGDPIQVVGADRDDTPPARPAVNPEVGSVAAGPDLLRPGSRGGGYGVAFVYAKGKGGRTLFATARGGHEDIVDLKHNRAFTERLVDAAVPDPAERERLLADPDDWIGLRAVVIRNCLFGRVGRHPKSGADLVMFWPNTERLAERLPDCLEYLKDRRLVTDDTTVTVGSSVYKTVGEVIESGADEMEKAASRFRPGDWWAGTTATEKGRQREREKAAGRWPYAIINTEARTFRAYLEARERDRE